LPLTRQVTVPTPLTGWPPIPQCRVTGCCYSTEPTREFDHFAPFSVSSATSLPNVAGLSQGAFAFTEYRACLSAWRLPRARLTSRTEMTMRGSVSRAVAATAWFGTANEACSHGLHRDRADSQRRGGTGRWQGCREDHHPSRDRDARRRLPALRRCARGGYRQRRPDAFDRAAQHQRQQREYFVAGISPARCRAGRRRTGVRSLYGDRAAAYVRENPGGDIFDGGDVRGARRQARTRPLAISSVSRWCSARAAPVFRSCRATCSTGSACGRTRIFNPSISTGSPTARRWCSTDARRRCGAPASAGPDSLPWRQAPAAHGSSPPTPARSRGSGPNIRFSGR
jgi:hypothetical protein